MLSHNKQQNGGEKGGRLKETFADTRLINEIAAAF